MAKNQGRILIPLDSSFFIFWIREMEKRGTGTTSVYLQLLNNIKDTEVDEEYYGWAHIERDKFRAMLGFTPRRTRQRIKNLKDLGVIVKCKGDEEKNTESYLLANLDILLSKISLTQKQIRGPLNSKTSLKVKRLKRSKKGSGKNRHARENAREESDSEKMKVLDEPASGRRLKKKDDDEEIEHGKYVKRPSCRLESHLERDVQRWTNRSFLALYLKLFLEVYEEEDPDFKVAPKMSTQKLRDLYEENKSKLTKQEKKLVRESSHSPWVISLGMIGNFLKNVMDDDKEKMKDYIQFVFDLLDEGLRWFDGTITYKLLFKKGNPFLREFIGARKRKRLKMKKKDRNREKWERRHG